MITFVGWKWHGNGYRETYTAQHVNIWAAGIKRHYRGPHRIVCVTDDAKDVECETFPLWKDCGGLTNPSGKHLPSCFRRLKIFSPLTTAEMGIDDGAKVASIDLDVVFPRDLVPIFDREEDFVGWKGEGTYNPVVYNGSMFMFRAGRMAKLWDDFRPESSPQAAVKARYFGSDQGWLSYKLNGSVPGWGTRDGVFSYSRDVRTTRQGKLPQMARIVSFNGKMKPWHMKAVDKDPWIKDHWRR